MNICAIYIAGSTGIYAATAFREYGRTDLFNLVFVGPLARSIALLVSGRLGKYFGLKKFHLWSVLAFAVTVAICVFVLAALKYREPDSKSLDSMKEVQK